MRSSLSKLRPLGQCGANTIGFTSQSLQWLTLEYQPTESSCTFSTLTDRHEPQKANQRPPAVQKDIALRRIAWPHNPPHSLGAKDLSSLLVSIRSSIGRLSGDDLVPALQRLLEMMKSEWDSRQMNDMVHEPGHGPINITQLHNQTGCIMSLIEQRMEELAGAWPVQLGMLLFQAGAHPLVPRSPGIQVLSATLDKLADLQQQQPGSLTSSLVDLVCSVAALQHKGVDVQREVLPHLGKLLWQNLGSMTTQEIARVVWALGRLRAPYPMLFRDAGRLLQPAVQSMDCKSVALVAWAFASTGNYSKPLFTALAEAAMAKTSLLSQHDVALLMTAMSSHRPAHQLFEALASASQDHLHLYQPKHLVGMFQACSRVRFDSAAQYLDKLSAVLEGRVGELKLHEVSLLMWSLVCSRHQHPGVSMACVRALQQMDIMRHANDATPRSAARLLHALAYQGQAGRGIAQQLAKMLQSRVQDLGVQDLVTALNACSRLGGVADDLAHQILDQISLVPWAPAAQHGRGIARPSTSSAGRWAEARDQHVTAAVPSPPEPLEHSTGHNRGRAGVDFLGRRGELSAAGQQQAGSVYGNPEHSVPRDRWRGAVSVSQAAAVLRAVTGLGNIDAGFAAPWLRRLMAQGGGALRAPELAACTWSAARLGLHDPESWRLMVQAIAGRAGQFLDVRSLADTFRSLGMALPELPAVSPDRVMQTLQQAALPLLSLCSTQQLVDIVWGSAVLGALSESFCGAVAQHVEYKWSSLAPQQAIILLWAFGQAGYSGANCYQWLANALLTKVSSLSVDDVALTMWCYNRAQPGRASSPLMRAVMRHTVLLVGSCDAVQLQRLAATLRDWRGGPEISADLLGGIAHRAAQLGSTAGLPQEQRQMLSTTLLLLSQSELGSHSTGGVRARSATAAARSAGGSVHSPVAAAGEHGAARQRGPGGLADGLVEPSSLVAGLLGSWMSGKEPNNEWEFGWRGLAGYG